MLSVRREGERIFGAKGSWCVCAVVQQVIIEPLGMPGVLLFYCS